MANELKFKGYIIQQWEQYPIPFKFYMDEERTWTFYVNGYLHDGIKDQDDFFYEYKDEWYETIEDFKADRAQSMKEKFEDLGVPFKSCSEEE